MYKEKGMFGGWKDVFLFTFRQGTKSKGFILATFGIAFLLLTAAIILNVVMGSSSNEDEFAASAIETVYVKDESGLEGLDFDVLDNLVDEGIFEKIKFESTDDIENSLSQGSSQNNAGLRITKEMDRYYMELFMLEGSDITEEDEEIILNMLIGMVEQGKLASSGISIEKLSMAMAPVITQFTDAGAEQETMGEMLFKLLVPLISCMIVYLMVLLYGQSIGKIVLAEKASKLMEMLLTSVRPYAIIAGKILAMASIAVLQFLIWIGSGIVGLLIGNQVALSMNPEYENALVEIMNLLRERSESPALSPWAILLSLVIVCTGFLFYSLLAGLVASSISKVEDMAQGMGLYQVVVIISFLVSYMPPALEHGVSEGLLITTLHYVPFTAPFILPGALLIGDVDVMRGVASLLVLTISIFLLVLLTGKVYKNQVFYKGDKKGLARMLFNS